MIELLEGLYVDANCLQQVTILGKQKPNKYVAKDKPYLVVVDTKFRSIGLFFETREEMINKAWELEDYLYNG